MADSMMTRYVKSSDIGEGVFTKYNKDQNYATWKRAEDLILTAVDGCAFESERSFSFRVADLGACDGGTSIPVMTEIIGCIRKKHGKSTPVEIIFEDLPTNDFKSLFMHMEGLIPGFDSFSEKKDNVFTSAVGRSFYEQCFPDNSINFAISINSLHFLSKRPCLLPHEFHPMLLPVDDPVLMKFAAQAMNDWENFLLQRSRELVPGGRLVVVALCHVPHPTEPKMMNYSIRGTQVIISNIWKQMLAEGLITQAEWEAVTLWIYHSSIEQFKSPFIGEKTPVQKSGLRLLSIRKYDTPLVKYDHLPIEEATKCLVGRIRTYISWAFLSQLTQRPEGEKEELLDELFRRFEIVLLKTGLDDVASYFHAHIVIEKMLH